MRLTSLCVLAAMLGISSGAAAQTFTYPNGYSLWTPLDSRIKYVGFAALVDASGAEIARVPVPNFFVASINVSFPAQATSVTVAKLRLGWTQTGTTAGIVDLDGAYTPSYKLTPPVAVPVGFATTVAFNTFSGAIVVTLIPPVPVVVPPPVVTPPPPPPLPTPPPPTAGESPDLSSIPPLTQIVNSIGEIWTKQGTHAFINGNDTGGSGFDTILYKCVPNTSPRLCVIYAHQSTGIWWKWVGGWAAIVGVP